MREGRGRWAGGLSNRLLRNTYCITLAIGLIFSVPCQAGVSQSGDTVVIEGRITDETADKFVDAVYGKAIRQVIFRNSTGGQWRAGQRLANLIVGRNLTTVAEGYCVSACATAFLAGDERLFSGATPSPMLAYHLPYSAQELTNIDNYAALTLAWLEKRTKRPIHPTVKAAILGGKPPAGGIFFLAEDDPEALAYGGLTTRVRQLRA